MHHVYVDYRADVGTPFYVGKGNVDRIRDFKNRNVVWHRIARKHGVKRDVVLVTSVHDIVLSEEIRLIRELKTRNYDGGANLTDGGEGSLGWDPTPETRQRMRAAKVGKKQSATHRASHSRMLVERYKSSVERRKTGDQQRHVWADPVYHERMAATRVGARNSRAVLTEGDVRQLRAEWDVTDTSKRGATKGFCTRHALRLNVTPENVYGIVTRRSWKHVT